MKIAALYSHLNGHEWLLVHEKQTWEEIETTINNIDAEKYKTKVSEEKTMKGKLLYAPIEINKAFDERLRKAGWAESRTSYWVTDDYQLIQQTMKLPPAEQTTVEAPDWDGGHAECGGGLHFSPHPALALEFDSSATRFIACPVALADIRPPHATDGYPAKIKARRLCGPIVEVDRYGKPVLRGGDDHRPLRAPHLRPRRRRPR